MSERYKIHKCTLWQSTETLLGSFNTVKEQLLGFVERRTAELHAPGYVVGTMVQVHVQDINTHKSIFYVYFIILLHME